MFKVFQTKFFSSLLAAFVLGGSVAAFEYGAYIDNNSKFQGQKLSNIKLSQINSGAVWVRSPLGSNTNNYFSMQGSYQHERDFRYKMDYDYVDLDLFKLNFGTTLFGNQLTAAAGRFFVSDLSSIVYTQNADGLYLNYQAPTYTVSLYGAYTGLLNANKISMIAIGKDAEIADSDKLYDFAEKYVISAGTISFLTLAENTSVDMQFLGAYRVEHKSTNRMYATISVNGPISSNIYYNTSYTLGWRNYDHSKYIKDALFRASATYFVPNTTLSLSGNFLYVTDMFVGFTSQDAVNSWDLPEYVDLCKPGATISIKPFSKLLLSLSGDIVFDSDLNYQGVQYRAAADLQLFSDLYIGGAITQYIDDDVAKNNRHCFQLKATLVL